VACCVMRRLKKVIGKFGGSCAAAACREEISWTWSCVLMLPRTPVPLDLRERATHLPKRYGESSHTEGIVATRRNVELPGTHTVEIH